MILFLPIFTSDENCSAVIRFTLSVSLPATFQVSKPPAKCPNTLSKPTRLKRVTASSSLPVSVTNKIGCFTFTIIAPTQGAKSPLKPILTDCGMKPFANSLSLRVSKINASVLSAIASNSSAESAFIPCVSTSSKLS